MFNLLMQVTATHEAKKPVFNLINYYKLLILIGAVYFGLHAWKATHTLSRALFREILV